MFLKINLATFLVKPWESNKTQAISSKTQGIPKKLKQIPKKSMIMDEKLSASKDQSSSILHKTLKKPEFN